MPVMDEFQQERETIKNASLKDKLIYFWDYYKWPTIAVIAVVSIVISLLHSFITHKDFAFYAMMINGIYSEVGEGHGEAFAEAAQIDTDKYEVYIDTSAYLDLQTMDDSTTATSQKLMVYTAAGDLDVAVTDTGSIEHYAYLGIFADLKEFLSPEDYQKYEPYFYYIDKQVLESQQEANNNYDFEKVIVRPENPLDPSTMAEPVPVGICVDNSEILKHDFYFRNGGNLVMTIFSNTEHPDTCIDYLHYLLP